MPMSHYQSIGQFMNCNEFCAFVNKVLNLVGFSMNSYLSLVLVHLLDAGIHW